MRGCFSFLLCLAAIASVAHADKPQIRIVTLGDSITKGFRKGVTVDETFAALLEKDLQKEGLKAEVVNVGIGGERTDQALKRLESVLDRSPQLVTIMYGTNDSYIDAGKSLPRLTTDQYRQNLLDLIARIRKASSQVVLMTAPRWGAKAKPNGAGEHPNVRLVEYVKICREVARETKTPLVDHYAHWLAEEKRGETLADWTTDQCHPNPQGHWIIANQILPVVLKTLKQ